jgi:hypothetical protein
MSAKTTSRVIPRVSRRSPSGNARARPHSSPACPRIPDTALNYRDIAPTSHPTAQSMPRDHAIPSFIDLRQTIAP